MKNKIKKAGNHAICHLCPFSLSGNGDRAKCTDVGGRSLEVVPRAMHNAPQDTRSWGVLIGGGGRAAAAGAPGCSESSAGPSTKCAEAATALGQ